MVERMTDKKILEEGVVHFFSLRKEYRSLSNFWERDMQIDGRLYESGEHCFHGEKYTRIGEQSGDYNRKMVLIEYGKTFLKPSKYKTPNIAKKMGGKGGLLLTNDELIFWESINLGVQFDICRWKMENYEDVRMDLLKSGDKLLIHPAMRCSDVKVTFRQWEGRAVVIDGKINILGRNQLGNVWMKIRDRMKLRYTNTIE
jgi:predicted NAD-dependent protein-ADP-ribosyltransferase YbiA (DUF1768 family)